MYNYDALIEIIVGLSVLLIAALFALPIIALASVSNLKQRVKYLEDRLKDILNAAPKIQEAKPEPIKAPETPKVHEAPPVQNVPEKLPEKTSLNAVGGARPKLQKIHRQPLSPQPPKGNSGDTQFNELGRRFTAWLGENLIAKIAVVILFFGISFLLKYSIDKGLLSPEIRVLGSLVLGFVLFGIGWRLRTRKELYSRILQGGGIGVLYLTIFAAFKLYALIPVSAAFILLAVICILSVYFAILQNAFGLAVLAFVGAYLSPILLSSGKGEHIILFSHYTVVSLALVVISRWRSWRTLNLIGFAFTVIATSLWYFKSYQIWFYPETQAFIAANLLIFGILAVLLFVRRERESVYHNIIDVVLLFGVPILSYALEYQILSHLEFAGAFAALAFGLFYMAGSFVVFKRFKTEGKRTALYMLGIGIGFATLAVPLAFDDNLTSLIWLFEGSAIAWAALRNNQHKLGLFGLLITIFGAVFAVYHTSSSDINTFVILYGFMSAILLFNACLFYRFKAADFKIESYILLALSTLSWICWIVKGSNITSVYLGGYDESYRYVYIILGFVVSSWFWYFVRKAAKWEALECAVISLWPALFLVILYQRGESLLLDISYILAFVSAYLYLYKGSFFKELHKNIEPVLHVSLFWTLLLWIYDKLELFSDHFLSWYDKDLNWSLFSVVFAAVILVVYIFQKKALFPFGRFLSGYWLIGLAPVILFLTVKLLSALYIGHGEGYIPILNPLEEGVIFTLLVLKFYLDKTLQNRQRNIIFFAYLAFALVCFLEINGIILRTLSRFLDIAWSFYYLWNSEVVQSVLSIVWTLLALALIIFANRSKKRKIWFVGMALLVIVVAKLVLHDSVKLEGLFRASVFIGVALLMLVIGFLAPIPPRENTNIKKD
ncbi:MAG: DUF2339 domain-containing protein [Campylobacteraceae bacterium]|jgi:uncharacterized membrane protein|nr:DUF2339 domain-containing protein [Campylobacteraceae bacterium]